MSKGRANAAVEVLELADRNFAGLDGGAVKANRREFEKELRKLCK